jgi:hypothetical protein
MQPPADLTLWPALLWPAHNGTGIRRGRGSAAEVARSGSVATWARGQRPSRRILLRDSPSSKRSAASAATAGSAGEEEGPRKRHVGDQVHRRSARGSFTCRREPDPDPNVPWLAEVLRVRSQLEVRERSRFEQIACRNPGSTSASADSLAARSSAWSASWPLRSGARSPQYLVRSAKLAVLSLQLNKPLPLRTVQHIAPGLSPAHAQPQRLGMNPEVTRNLSDRPTRLEHQRHTPLEQPLRVPPST